MNEEKRKEYWILRIRKPNRRNLKYCVASVPLFLGLLFRLNDGMVIPYLYGVAWTATGIIFYYMGKAILQ